jgi:hypothetical protein
MSIKNILFHSYDFDIKIGGITVGYELCKILDSMGVNIRVCAQNYIDNSIFSKYYDNNDNFKMDETLVMYGETIWGNPLNAKYVARWILAPIGTCSNIENCKTWSKNDLVYYFNSEKKFDLNPELIGDIYKTLTCIYISPLIKNNHNNKRSGHCHTFRKNHMRKKFVRLHPNKSFEITRQHTQEDYVNIFNEKEIFISYDPLTFMSIIAAMCGCISIVIKVQDCSSQLEWLQTTAVRQYVNEKKIERLYGIAYGIDEIGWARDTIHLVEDQWVQIKEFLKEKTIIPFLEDLKNIETLKNTVENNYFK